MENKEILNFIKGIVIIYTTMWFIALCITEWKTPIGQFQLGYLVISWLCGFGIFFLILGIFFGILILLIIISAVL